MSRFWTLLQPCGLPTPSIHHSDRSRSEWDREEKGNGNRLNWIWKVKDMTKREKKIYAASLQTQPSVASCRWMPCVPFWSHTTNSLYMGSVRNQWEFWEIKWDVSGMVMHGVGFVTVLHRIVFGDKMRCYFLEGPLWLIKGNGHDEHGPLHGWIIC